MSYIEDLFSLKGKNAVVTGAASGLGQQCTQVLAKAGANVALFDLNELGMHETIQMIGEIGVKLLSVKVDVSQLEQIERGIHQAIAAFEHIDILVNSAGIILVKPALETTEQDWDRVFDINIKGTWLMCQTIAKHMVEKKVKGSIINISSADSHRTQKDMTPYGASKAAVNHLTRSLSYELVPYGIRVNAIAPGGMLTNMVKEFLQTPGGQNAVWGTPFKRFAEMSELDGTLLLVASDASNYMTGSVVTIDGGLSCNTIPDRDE